MWIVFVGSVGRVRSRVAIAGRVAITIRNDITMRAGQQTGHCCNLSESVRERDRDREDVVVGGSR